MASRGAFDKLKQVAVRASETARPLRADNDGPRGTDGRGTEKVGALQEVCADTIARCHRVGRRAVLQIRRSPFRNSAQYDAGTPRPRTVALA